MNHSTFLACLINSGSSAYWGPKNDSTAFNMPGSSAPKCLAMYSETALP